jgi:hypothetical protein
MAQTKPKASQFYGVSGEGTAGQVLISDGNGGMSWGSNTEQYTVSWATPTGQSLTYTQPNPQSSTGAPGGAFPTTTFTATKSGEEISGTASIAGLPTGVVASQSLSGTGVNNILTVTLGGVFPSADSLNTNLTISGLTVQVPLPPLTINYLVIAGGGGGGNGSGGAGGGAGGYRTNQGGTALTLNAATNYAITVGSGGPALAQGVGSQNHGVSGNNSIFHNITATGGGGGGSENDKNGYSGGSGGGANYNSNTPGSGNAGNYNPVEGYAGGNGGTAPNYSGGGGGGAGQVGGNAGGSSAGNGGNGLSNNITGSSVTYAGGGGGGSQDGGNPGTPGTGGSGGGGNGAAYTGAAGSDGTPNTGGGGGGTAFQISGGPTAAAGYGGGSGVVILRYPAAYTISGLSGSTVTVGTDEVTTFTAGTGNVQFN